MASTAFPCRTCRQWWRVLYRHAYKAAYEVKVRVVGNPSSASIRRHFETAALKSRSSFADHVPASHERSRHLGAGFSNSVIVFILHLHVIALISKSDCIISFSRARCNGAAELKSHDSTYRRDARASAALSGWLLYCLKPNKTVAGNLMGFG